MPEINYLAVLMSAIVSMVIGGLWYGPLFGRVWMRGQGWNPDDKQQMEKMKKAAGPAYAQMFVLALVQMYVFAHILWAFGAALKPAMGILASGLSGGFWTWLGFVLPVKYGDKLWSGKAFKYVAVDLGYYLALLLITGTLLSFWK